MPKQSAKRFARRLQHQIPDSVSVFPDFYIKGKQESSGFYALSAECLSLPVPPVRTGRSKVMSSCGIPLLRCSRRCSLPASFRLRRIAFRQPAAKPSLRRGTQAQQNVFIMTRTERGRRSSKISVKIQRLSAVFNTESRISNNLILKTILAAVGFWQRFPVP